MKAEDFLKKYNKYSATVKVKVGGNSTTVNTVILSLLIFYQPLTRYLMKSDSAQLSALIKNLLLYVLLILIMAGLLHLLARWLMQI